jgi:hypothetical protein
MQKETKVILYAGLAYLGYMGYRIYSTIKNLKFNITGVRFSIIRSRMALGGTLFVEIVNPVNQTINITDLRGTVTDKAGNLLGDYKTGAITLRPGTNSIRISWGSRSTAILIPIVAGILKGSYPTLILNTTMTYKGIPIPSSYTLDTKNYIPTLDLNA